jgi:hypothetical protein
MPNTGARGASAAVQAKAAQPAYSLPVFRYPKVRTLLGRLKVLQKPTNGGGVDLQEFAGAHMPPLGVLSLVERFPAETLQEPKPQRATLRYVLGEGSERASVSTTRTASTCNCHNLRR